MILKAIEIKLYLDSESSQSSEFLHLLLLLSANGDKNESSFYKWKYPKYKSINKSKSKLFTIWIDFYWRVNWTYFYLYIYINKYSWVSCDTLLCVCWLLSIVDIFVFFSSSKWWWSIPLKLKWWILSFLNWLIVTWNINKIVRSASKSIVCF